MPKVELFVGLKIPDTTAITTLHTIEKMGYNVKKVKREFYYKFDIDGDKENLKKKIGKVDILVNANKNKYSTELEKEDAVYILIQEIDDECESLLTTLRDRLGFTEIKKMEKGVLWILDIDSKEKAKEIAEKLLYNEHYQNYKIL